MSWTLAQNAGDVLEWTNRTSVHPVGLAVLVTLAASTFVLPRRWAIAPLLILACFVPAGQRIVVATLDFSFLRLLVIAYFLRIVLFRDFRGLRPLALDYAVVAWVLVGSLVYVLLRADMAGLTNRLGHTYEALGLYLVFRCLIRTWQDMDRALVVLAILALPVAALFLFEQATGRNVFSVMGGVPPETLVRQGRRRAQGAFSHPIMAGVFWAIVLVLCAGMAMAGQRRLLMASGAAGCLCIIIACASSTPVLAVLAAGVGLTMGFARPALGIIRFAAPFILIALHLSMQAPVWHLIARVSAVGGSTGWHRYHLIDAAINRFGEWAVLGVETTAHWGMGLRDVTNQYILEGVRGGVWTLLLFLLVIVLGFRAVGVGLRRQRDRKGKFWVTWAIGVSLFTHSACFIAVSYFGQTIVAWYLSLALAAAVQQMPHPERRVRRMQRADRSRVDHRGQFQHSGNDPGVPAIDPGRRGEHSARGPRG